jgi:hypothetical protein
MASELDAGDHGFVRVLSWHGGHKYIATLEVLSGRMPPPFQVVIISLEGFKGGTFRILEKNYINRKCILEIDDNDFTFRFKVQWLLDEPLPSLQQH